MSNIPIEIINKILLYNIHPVAEIIKKAISCKRNLYYSLYDRDGFNRYGYRKNSNYVYTCFICLRDEYYCRC